MVVVVLWCLWGLKRLNVCLLCCCVLGSVFWPVWWCGVSSCVVWCFGTVVGVFCGVCFGMGVFCGGVLFGGMRCGLFCGVCCGCGCGCVLVLLWECFVDCVLGVGVFCGVVCVL